MSAETPNATTGSPVLLCLHGWGGSKESFTELRAALKDDDITILTPDLPGFGDEPEPKEPWSVSDYAEWTLEWLQHQKAVVSGQPWYILGHSHGGRIIIKLISETLPASHFPLPAHIFLCASAGIRRRRHFKRMLGLVLAKTGKTLMKIPGLSALQPLARKLLYRLVRVHDYEKASPVMQKTMIRVAREDLRPHLKDITVPTDLFWGTDDGMTPYADAKIMEREIPGAVLHSYPGVRHRVHRDKAEEIAAVIRSRIA